MDMTNIAYSFQVKFGQANEQKKVKKSYEYRDIFSDVPKVTNLGKHEINLTTDNPVQSKAYVFPFAMRKVVDKELDEMI